MATTRETENRSEPVTPILNTLIEAIKNATSDTERDDKVKKAVEDTRKITPNQEDLEISQAQLTTKNIEDTGKWVGHTDNAEFVNKYAYVKSGEYAKQLEQSKAMLKAVFPVGNPDWLIASPDSIQHCAEAAEFVSRVSLLPQKLRENPDVLYRETMRYSASLEWGTMTIDAQKEAHHVLDNAMRKYLELRYQNEISVDEKIAEKMLQSLTQSSSETGKTPVFYVENEEIKNIPKPAKASITLHEQLAELQKQVKMDDALLHDKVQLAKTIAELKRDYGEDAVVLYVAKLRHMQSTETVVQKIERDEEYEGRREKYWTNLGIHEADMAPTWVNEKEAKWAIEEILQKIESTSTKYPTGLVIESLENNTRNLMGYFASKDYKQHLTEFAERQWPGQQEKIQEHVDNMLKQVPEIQEKIKNRMGALITYGHITLKGDPKTISESLLQLGTRGVNFILAENNGINERVYNRYVSLMKLGRFNPQTHKEEPYGAETLFELRRRIKDEIKDDIDLYNEQYQSCWGETHKLDAMAIDSIVRQTEVVVKITQQDLVAVLGAPGPGKREQKYGDYVASSSFLSMNTAERFLSAMDVDSYAFEKWNKLTDYPLYMWRRMCEMAAKGSEQYKAAIAERLNGVQQGDEKFKALATEAFGSKEKMAGILELEHKANPGAIRLPGEYHAPKTFSELSMKELKRELTIQEGKKVVTEILEAYDDLSSGWRIKQYLIQLNRMYGTEAPPISDTVTSKDLEKEFLYGPHHLGLGMQLRLAGYDLIHAENEGSRKHSEIKVQRILKDEIAQYRPQATFEFLHTNHDKEAAKTFDNMKSGKKLTRERLGEGIGEDITHIDQFYHYISRRFVTINDMLADRGLSPINYAMGPTKEQMEVVEKVCAVTKVKASSYIDVMKELTTFAGDENNYKKMTETPYYQIYHRTQWIDDLRTRYLENPDTAPGSRTKEKYDASGKTIQNIKLSETFVEDGSGGGDQHPRAWGDLGVAIETLDALTDGLTHDKKQFFENVIKVYKGVGRYSGYKPAGARAAIYMLSGFGEAAATDKEINLLMLNSIENSSVAKRLVGDKGLSLSPGELLEVTEEFEGLLMSKLHGLAPHLAEEAEKFIGIRWGWVPDWMGEVGHHLPAWGDRAKIAIILIGLLILTQAIKEGEKELSGGQGGKQH